VAIYCKQKPKKVQMGIGMHDIDQEGRYIEVQFEKLSVISLYMHSGSSSEERQGVKFDFMDRFMPYLHKLKRKRREFVICGDWNIQEREWMTKLFDEAINKKPHEYTWWSNRGQAWANNTGWRIDYQIVTPKLGGTVKKTHIQR